MNKETLEDVAYRLYPIILEDDGWDKNKQYRDEWTKGAKWQQERSYSEEDMQDFAKFCLLCKDEELPYIFPKDWLKHIKNKI